MLLRRYRFWIASMLGILFCSFAAAQIVTVGNLGVDNFHFDAGPITVLDLNHPVTVAGQVDQATITWSAAPCAAAATIRFFRPTGSSHVLVDQRGPFNIDSTTQVVALVPPVSLQPGDKIAVHNNTACGTPTGHTPGTGGGGYFVFGDETQIAIPVPPPPAPVDVLVFASSGISLHLLSGRFRIDLQATNPRTGSTAVGQVASQTNGAASFSIPAFTGDPTFPEVTVKMVDATGAPPPFGGAFWFFYSTLTDSTIHLVVTDSTNGRTRTYDCAPPDSSHLCSVADTAAFTP